MSRAFIVPSGPDPADPYSVTYPSTTSDIPSLGLTVIYGASLGSLPPLRATRLRTIHVRLPRNTPQVS